MQTRTHCTPCFRSRHKFHTWLLVKFLFITDPPYARLACLQCASSSDTSPASNRAATCHQFDLPRPVAVLDAHAPPLVLLAVYNAPIPPFVL